MTELLLQSHAGEIHLLPALPSAWPEGSVSGLRARGGFTVELAWKAGKLTSATLRAGRPGRCTIRYDALVRTKTLRRGEELIWEEPICERIG